MYVHSERYVGFTINLELLPEYTEPDWEMTPKERTALMRKIANGSMLYFCAEVTASKLGIVLATDHLGACCYTDVGEFVKDDYYKDMRASVVADAKEMIVKLAEESV